MNNATEKFSASMQKLDLAFSRIAVAVSGGGDSMALALLMQEWARQKGGEVLALTVDHGLRPESKAEAEAVNALLKKRGIAHEILPWQGEKPATHIQERAREMRYKLLAAECKKRGFPVLAVAHNAEDQMETFWMRLAHGSGLDGLAGMAPSRELEGLRLIRPLLSFTRAELREVCKAADVEWVEDPSNMNEKFLRPKLRGFEEILAGEGLTPQRLAQTTQKLSDARAALEYFTDKACDDSVTLHPAGYATLQTKNFSAQPVDIQRRLISRLLNCIAPQEYAAGHEAIEPLRADLAGTFTGRTIAGCEIFPDGDAVVFSREAAAVKPAKPQDGMVWDGRFKVSGYPHLESLTVSLLGENGVSILRKSVSSNTEAAKALEALPGKIRRGLASIWQGENLVSVPCLSWVAAGAPKGLETGRLTFIGRVKIV